MTTLFTPLLAAALISQFQRVPLQGTVVDDAGKPVAGASVVFYCSTPLEIKKEPTEVRATTAAEGQFRIVVPALQWLPTFRAHVWAFRPGLAFAATGLDDLSKPLVLYKAVLKTLKIEGPDGQPVVGARIAPRVIWFAAGSTPASMPESLAEPRAVTTGPDGNATLDYLAAGDRLVAARITTELVGTQDFQLVARPALDRQGTEITFQLKRTSRLIGRVRTRAGEPVAGQTVEVWGRGGSLLEPHPVAFKDGPLRTGPDGSFQTPDNLLVGSPYRLLVQAPGKETIVSDRITIGGQPCKGSIG